LDWEAHTHQLRQLEPEILDTVKVFPAQEIAGGLLEEAGWDAILSSQSAQPWQHHRLHVVVRGRGGLVDVDNEPALRDSTVAERFFRAPNGHHLLHLAGEDAAVARRRRTVSSASHWSPITIT